MDKLEYELVTLKNGKQYFVLEDILFEYDTYDLILNVEDENDIKIVFQEIKNGKLVLTDVEDPELLRKLSPLFDERIRLKQEGI
ncbi:MAG: hypothetical protein IJH20_01120 [Bacilli bacterium]|nr:hypothetical protein [Bacilli bacterium]